MDSKNISRLIDSYYQGNISHEEETMLLDYLQNNPKAVSEEGYDMLVDKLVYEHSLLERKALFQEMMKNPPSPFFAKYSWPLVFSAVVFVLGIALFLYNNSLRSSQLRNKTEVTNNATRVTKATVAKDSGITIKSTNKIQQFESRSKEYLKTNALNDANLFTQNKQRESVIHNVEIKTKANNDISKAAIKTDDMKQNNSQPVFTQTCPDYTKEITIKTSKSEISETNGSMVIISKKSILEYSIDNETFSTETSFEHLAPGYYKLYVRDNNNCSNTIQGILIDETACFSDYKKDIIKGQTWKIPLSIPKVKDIVIYNTAGQIVFKKTQDFTEEFEWDGMNNQGIELIEGFYKVVISYQKETCIFNVSKLQ